MLQHVGYRRLGGVEGGRQADGNDVIPLVLRKVLYRGDELDACVVAGGAVEGRGGGGLRGTLVRGGGGVGASTSANQQVALLQLLLLNDSAKSSPQDVETCCLVVAEGFS